jgi:cbb3-type cytochrome oxidase subunit 3
MKHTEHFSNKMRLNWEHTPKGWELMPWLSSGTYGEHDAQQVLDVTAHNFANGATGINFYTPGDWDDLADILNMAYVIGYVSPYEDIIMDGNLSYMNFTASTNAVTSGMGLNGKYFLAVSAKNTSNPVTFSFEVTNVSEHYNLYDMHNKKHYNYTPGGVIDFNDILPECGVFILQPYDPTPPPPPELPPFMNASIPADGAINISLNTSLHISIYDNNTDTMNITWMTDASGTWQEITTTNSVTNGTYSISPGLFTFYNTTYNWAVHLTDGLFWSNETFSFKTIPSDAPIYYNATPADGFVNVSVNLTELSIVFEDPEGDLLDWSITSFPNIGSASAVNDTNGTKTCTISGLVYNATYNWYVDLTDPMGSGVPIDLQFTFTTEWEPVNITPPPPPPPPPPPNIDPVCVINGPYFGYREEPVQFSSDGTIDPDGHIVSFFWQFGDGTNSTEASPEHAYADMGNFSVSLTIIDNRSSEIINSTHAIITRRNNPPTTPVINGTTNLLTDKSYQFGFKSTDPDGDRLKYHIDWGDGQSASVGFFEGGVFQFQSHIWQNAGNFTIEVYAEDWYDGAQSGKAYFDVQVAELYEPPPPPDDDDDTKEESSMWVWALVIVIIIIILIIVAILVFVFLRKKKEEEEEEEDEEEDESEEEDILPDPAEKDLPPPAMKLHDEMDDDLEDLEDEWMDEIGEEEVIGEEDLEDEDHGWHPEPDEPLDTEFHEWEDTEKEEQDLFEDLEDLDFEEP